LIRPFDRTQIFTGVQEAVFRGVAMESLLGDEEVWSAILEYRLKRAITFDPTVGSHSKNLQEFREAVFLSITMQSLIGDEELWSTRLEYCLKSSITFDQTVGSC
jgi:hypothetical protein